MMTVGTVTTIPKPKVETKADVENPGMARPQSTRSLASTASSIPPEDKESYKLSWFNLGWFITIVLFQIGDYVPHTWARPLVANATAYNNTLLTTSTFEGAAADYSTTFWFSWGNTMMIVTLGLLMILIYKGKGCMCTNMEAVVFTERTNFVLLMLMLIGCICVLSVWATGHIRTYNDFRIIAALYGGCSGGAKMLICFLVCKFQTVGKNATLKMQNKRDLMSTIALSAALSVGGAIAVPVAKTRFNLAYLQEPLHTSIGCMSGATFMVLMLWMFGPNLEETVSLSSAGKGVRRMLGRG
jgi:hypothetical protein